MRRPAEEAAKTRASLLLAALSAFEELGWKGATFEQISKRAGVTRGALHHHFQKKTDLLSEALESGWNEYGDKLFSSIIDPRSQPILYLENLLRQFILMLQDDRRFRSLVSTTVLVAPQAFSTREDKAGAFANWRTHIFRAMSSVRSDEDAARNATSLFLVVLQGLTISAVTSPGDLPGMEDVDDAVKLLVRGITG